MEQIDECGDGENSEAFDERVLATVELIPPPREDWKFSPLRDLYRESSPAQCNPFCVKQQPGFCLYTWKALFFFNHLAVFFSFFIITFVFAHQDKSVILGK